MARPRSTATDGHDRLDPRQAARIRHDPGDRRCGRRQRRGEERPAALALATLEVAVRGGDRVLAGRQLVAIHRDAHRAAGLSPLRPGGPEDLVQTLALGLSLHLVGAGHDHHPDAVRDVTILEDRSSEAEVADAAVRAGADEDDIDLLAEDLLARAQVHVLEGVLEG